MQDQITESNLHKMPQTCALGKGMNEHQGPNEDLRHQSNIPYTRIATRSTSSLKESLRLALDSTRTPDVPEISSEYTKMKRLQKNEVFKPKGIPKTMFDKVNNAILVVEPSTTSTSQIIEKILKPKKAAPQPSEAGSPVPSKFLLPTMSRNKHSFFGKKLVKIQDLRRTLG